MIEVVNIKYSNAYIKISLDTGESLKLTPDIYNMYPISKGKIIDNALYQQLKEESIRLSCKLKALNYLAIRNRSYQEMHNYLIKKGFPRDIIDETLKGFKADGYINDYEYAVRFINSKKKSKIIGENVLKRDLYKKGINRDIIKRAIRETGANQANIDDLYKLALKKIKNLENKKNKMTKLIYFLKQKGFIEDQVRLVIDRLNEEGYKL